MSSEGAGRKRPAVEEAAASSVRADTAAQGRTAHCVWSRLWGAIRGGDGGFDALGIGGRSMVWRGYGTGGREQGSDEGIIGGGGEDK